jgi:RNA polymerase sigma-70 factor (ECF subfamily)
MSIKQKQLVKQAQNGDQEAFGQLYELYFEKIYRFIYFKTTDRQTTEDLTSQTFFKALENLAKFKGEIAQFKSWIYKIAHNLVIDHYRTNRDHTPLDLAQDLAAPEQTAAKTAINLELEKVINYLDTLDPQDRQLIVLRIWDELSYREIAAIIGKSEASLKMQFSRLLKKVRNDLKSTVVIVLLLLLQL